MLNETKVHEIIKAKQVKKQKGASFIEYAVLIGGIVTIGAVLFGGTSGGTVGTAISTKITDALK